MVGRLDPQRWRLRAAQYLKIVGSGLLMWAAFPELSLWLMAFPSLVLLFSAVTETSLPRAAWYGALWAMVFFVPHISWIDVATDGATVPWLLLCLAQAAFIALWAVIFVLLQRWPWANTWWGTIIVAATTWTGIEQLRARIPYGGFPWAKVAYSQVEGPLLGLAPTGGETLVTWWTAAVAAGALVAVRTVGKRPALGWSLACGSAAALLAPALIVLPTDPQTGTLQAAAIQGNVAIPMVDTYGNAGEVTSNHVDQTLAMVRGGGHPEVVFWGEDSIDRDPNENATTAAMVEQVLQATGVPLVAGYQEHFDGYRLNWVSVWYPGTGQSDTRYGKQHPVPWGEFIPMRELSYRIAAESALIAVDMHPVDNPGFMEVQLNSGQVLPVALGICFEVGDEFILAEGVRIGGQLLYVPTNNAQFQYSAESTQQLQMLQFRSAEFGRAGLQVSTNGVSAVVSPDGTVLQQTPKQVPAYLEATLPLRQSLTVAAVLGQWPALILIALTLGAPIASVAVRGVAQARKRQEGRNA